METGYDNEALIKFFKEGLPDSLVNKIMLRSEEAPTTLDEWFSLSICYDNQYKFAMAQKKKRMEKETVKPKIQRKEKEVTIGRLSKSDKHISKDCPLKKQTNQAPPIKAMVLEQGEAEQEEIFDLMGKEAKLNRHSMHMPFTYNVRTEIVEGKALIDSGAGGRFISEEEAQHIKKPWTKLIKPIKVYNVDGTRNKTGWITHSITLDINIGERSMKETFLISGHQLGNGSRSVQTAEKDFSLESYARKEDSDEIRINAKLSTSQVLAQAHKTKAKSLEELIPPYIADYKDRFEKKKAEQLPPSQLYDHAIDLKPDFKPKDCKVYLLSPKEQEEQDKFLDENLRKGYIRLSKSPIASPFFFVAKKEYPLPLVTDLINKLKNAKVFTKLDLWNGYNNIRIKNGDQWKAVFKTPRGLFELMDMFFGLMNSPATFQAFMNDILKDFIDERWCVVYMDDILIFSDDLELHRLCTRRLLECLWENNLFLKPEKCKFEVTRILFLGLIITPGHTQMDPTKLAGIAEWEVPKMVKGVRSFLGFTNFYRKFIGKYAELAWPLHNLMKKTSTFEWTKRCQITFDVLKAKFLQQPILKMPDDTQPFMIEADASKWVTGAVLRQRGSDGELHPCGYISHAFMPTERNYEIYNQELLAIVNALKAWQHYLLGAPHPVTILSNHKNLTSALHRS
ncbi:hypothetical protein Moror_1400 [Moniliophthora roreri MCA 2997]|uniref:Reverse transcriptase domain-containing protein n=1 Tax=Moniliophthora roreri (strain MCA 2997) TaxID=1381753 RepID=V2W7R9_MONRO|nr:hypothetical protein Moror_1400 [Moniliophthora roreri MCA 2997]